MRWLGYSAVSVSTLAQIGSDGVVGELNRAGPNVTKPLYEAKIEFFEDIYEPNYLPAIAEKAKPFEVDGWKACLEGRFSPFKMLSEGKYLVSFLRKVNLE